MTWNNCNCRNTGNRWTVCQLRAVYFWNPNTISPFGLERGGQGKQEQFCKESKYDIQQCLITWRKVDISCHLCTHRTMVSYCTLKSQINDMILCLNCNTLNWDPSPPSIYFSWTLHDDKLLQEFSLNQPHLVKYSSYGKWRLNLKSGSLCWPWNYSKPSLGSASKSRDVGRGASGREGMRPLRKE